ncbi:MAG: hypothetical protein DBX59_07115 [Bacillota bacterium]|nr:MAG: hypothetical protein DBX59_07115 [Bacillota bacterium]
MEKIFKTLVVGGGAAGLVAGVRLARIFGGDVCVAERGERLGRKLSLTGNGQGNLTNSDLSPVHYRSGAAGFFKTALAAYPFESAREFYRSVGIRLTAETGRKYPLSKQASAVTDALRFCLEGAGARVLTSFHAVKAQKKGGVFTVTAADGRTVSARTLLFAFGGKAAKHLGTDGSSFALAEGFGHTIAPLYPSLVQLTTETEPIRGLKGIKAEARVRAKGRYEAESAGEVLFADYGVSGSAVFAASGAVSSGGTLAVEFLPAFSEGEVLGMLKERAALGMPLTGGILHNQLGRTLEKRAGGDVAALARLIKNFSLKVTGSLGFDAAQVSAGGVRADEIDEKSMESRLVKGLYFAGEAMDVDGDCGGYNLHWAFASASSAAAHISEGL